MENDVPKGGAENVSVLLLLVPGCYVRCFFFLPLVRSKQPLVMSMAATTATVV
jgi:hypothetical protein